jgi:hypothetical protein
LGFDEAQPDATEFEIVVKSRKMAFRLTKARATLRIEEVFPIEAPSAINQAKAFGDEYVSSTSSTQ